MGELAQAASAFQLKQSREQYIFRISSKTARSFRHGDRIRSSPEQSAGKNRSRFCMITGSIWDHAFQIIDDILDFIGTEEEMGKPVAPTWLRAR